jgi:hypothetical protein
VWDDAHLFVNGVVMFELWCNGVIWQTYGGVLKMNRNLLKGILKFFLIPCQVTMVGVHVGGAM